LAVWGPLGDAKDSGSRLVLWMLKPVGKTCQLLGVEYGPLMFNVDALEGEE